MEQVSTTPGQPAFKTWLAREGEEVRFRWEGNYFAVVIEDGRLRVRFCGNDCSSALATLHDSTNTLTVVPLTRLAGGRPRKKGK